MVERQLPKLEVAGSKPVVRSFSARYGFRSSRGCCPESCANLIVIAHQLNTTALGSGGGQLFFLRQLTINGHLNASPYFTPKPKIYFPPFF